MTQAEKFLFKTSFDEGALAREAERARQAEAPTYDSADLAEARETALAEGKQAGLAEALAGAEQAQANALTKIEEDLARLREAAVEVNERRERRAIEVAVTVVRKLFPRLAAECGLGEIEALLEDCLAHLDDEPRIVVRVNDAQLDALRERIDPIAQRCGFEGRTVLLSEPGLGLGDAHVEWADGGAEHDGKALWDKIDALLARNHLFATAEQPEAEPAPLAVEPTPHETPITEDPAPTTADPAPGRPHIEEPLDE